ncbi:hypothetical protein JZ751_001024 [Albula glossodonta]|uniref:Uncharacterized protein n=1 Tax=Albula glossodonta TaxID=121402 RepID=A0A8T2PSJ5_9TELE|nr:hypothetical protein JZ751_001024 [Albula glossodonta]
MYQRYIQHRAGDFRPVYPDEVTEACQWELMEDKMAAVKSTMAQDSKIHNADRFKMMKDNAQLIMQINSLSEELALVKNKVCEYEKQLSVNCRRKKSRFPAIQASVVLSTQPISQASIFNAEESDRIIQLQRMEIAKLRGEIETQEFTQLPRPPHRSKLPPIVS